MRRLGEALPYREPALVTAEAQTENTQHNSAWLGAGEARPTSQRLHVCMVIERRCDSLDCKNGLNLQLQTTGLKLRHQALDALRHD
jgi:hypothetical protein